MQQTITSFEDACKVRGIDPVLPDVSMLPERFQKSAIANYKLDVINEAVNDGHVFDWNDYGEYKYYPWWDMETYGDEPAGSGFAFGDYGNGSTYSLVGSRRVFRTREDAEYAAKQFIELYRDAMFIPQ